MKHVMTGATLVLIVASSVFLYLIFSTPCILLKDGDTDKVIAFYPVNEGDEFSITFVHSVNKTPVTDVYEYRDGSIFVIRTIYYSFGAGVQTEVGEGQTLEYAEDGSMIVSGFDKQMDSLSYIVGTVSDHMLEIGNESVSLRELCGRNATVKFIIGRRLFV